MPSLFLIALYIVSFLSCLLAILALDDRRRRKGLPYPPGPKGLPVIGNILDVPKDAPWVTYARWAKIYGWDWLLPSARDDEQWRVERRAVDRSLGPSAILNYQPMQKLKTHTFLKNLLLTPKDFLSHIAQLQGSIIMSVVYGYDIHDSNDKLLEKAKEFAYVSQALVQPGALLVNDLPFLKYLPEWLPGMGFKQLARDCRTLGEESINGPIAFVKKAMEHGTARPSMALDDLLHCNSEEDERRITTALGSIHIVSALSSFFLMLVLYPQVQKRAQAEIDIITEGTSLPDFSDRARLPYVDALYIVQRTTSLENGGPYRGYFIPKGSIVIANIWAILHDPELYPEPEVFRPERFLTADGEPRDDPMLSAVWGFGKRICPGWRIVNTTLFLVVASVVSAFTVGIAKDAEGKEIPVREKYSGKTLSHPEPFECSIVPRCQYVEELLSASLAREQ
ncbi:cytochrome P450 [Artomyces pyxidatus]|uniref:Cytochrome P450 n=1 Tax=Artomyces pyxidatus TaxID=48021 RepID=A0ACB8SYS5_9AGAM|nr:cytochrome P450 [Artomyces pyxidatus]